MPTRYEFRLRCSKRLRRVANDPDLNWPRLIDALEGCKTRRTAVLLIADLVDPSAWEGVARENEMLYDQCRGKEDENARLRAENARLRAENARLKAQVRALELVGNC